MKINNSSFPCSSNNEIISPLLLNSTQLDQLTNQLKMLSIDDESINKVLEKLKFLKNEMFDNEAIVEPDGLLQFVLSRFLTFDSNVQNNILNICSNPCFNLISNNNLTISMAERINVNLTQQIILNNQAIIRQNNVIMKKDNISPEYFNYLVRKNARYEDQNQHLVNVLSIGVGLPINNGINNNGNINNVRR